MNHPDQGTSPEQNDRYPDFDESFEDFKERLLPILEKGLSREDKELFIKMVFYGSAFTLVQLIKACYKNGKQGEKQIKRVFSEIVNVAIDLCESPLPRIDLPD
jgi:hypothetical protein